MTAFKKLRENKCLRTIGKLGVLAGVFGIGYKVGKSRRTVPVHITAVFFKQDNNKKETEDA